MILIANIDNRFNDEDRKTIDDYSYPKPQSLFGKDEENLEILSKDVKKEIKDLGTREIGLLKRRKPVSEEEKEEISKKRKKMIEMY